MLQTTIQAVQATLKLEMTTFPLVSKNQQLLACHEWTENLLNEKITAKCASLQEKIEHVND